MTIWPSYSEQLNPTHHRVSAALITLLLLSYTSIAFTFEQTDSNALPHVGEKAREGFLQYQHSAGHKAFAIAPGGAWYWVTETTSEDQAEEQALQNCQSQTQQKCVLYALNDRIVFNADNWPGLWGPYADTDTAIKAKDGTRVGQRFPDISWLEDNKKMALSDMKGKIILLHFWGSWCPPCMREFPSLKKLHAKLQSDYSMDIEMLLMQLREPFEDSIKWATRYGFSDLPLVDSGIKDSESTQLTLNDGRQIKDRELARVFPSTYVIDRNGLVIFSHHGPIANWLDYVAFFEHAVKNTEKPGTSTAKKKQP